MIIDCHGCVGGTTTEGKSCSQCGGDGKIDLLDDAFKRIRYSAEKRLMGYVWSNLLENTTMPVGVFRSYEVLECLDATEHAALTDPQKDGVLHLLACGKIDLNDGKVGKTRLWNWFGAESTTVANLTELLS
jgi:hypothetical protein